MNKTQQNKTRRQNKSARRQRGFTLTEVMVALPMVALLLGGTVALFLGSQRMVQRTSVSVQSSQDATIGFQFIGSTAREAIQFALPPDTATVNTNGMAFLPPDGNLNDYQNGNINTAVELLLPAAAMSKKANNQPVTPGLALLDRSGQPLTAPGYDRTRTQVSSGIPVDPLVGNLVCIYRSDALGHPSPASGQYLWALTRPAPAGLYDPSYDTQQKLCRLILTKHADGTPATDAVQFIGCKSLTNTDIPASMPYELEYKLICGDQTAINGTQTNEGSGSGSITALSGKCALMRNHN